VSIQWHDVPQLAINHRYQMESLGNGFVRVALQYGFKDDVDIPQALSHIPQWADGVDWTQASYFLGRETLIPAVSQAMPYWQELVFIALYRIATSATNFFRLPTNRVVELGSQIVL
jgi:KUP system potassium uptake protein